MSEGRRRVALVAGAAVMSVTPRELVRNLIGLVIVLVAIACMIVGALLYIGIVLLLLVPKLVPIPMSGFTIAGTLLFLVAVVLLKVGDWIERALTPRTPKTPGTPAPSA